MLNPSKQTNSVGETNPVKQAVLSAYNEAVYNIAVKYSFVVAQREDIRVPIDSAVFLLTIFEHKAFALEQVVKHYYQNISNYFVKFLHWRLTNVWPLAVEDIETVVELINFSHYDKNEFIFSPRNVDLLTEAVSNHIRTYPPNHSLTEAKTFVIDPDFRGTEIGMDRHLGEVHDHTLLFCFIFLLIVVIIYLVATDNMLL